MEGVIALVMTVGQLTGGFLVVYWAARLAIRHESRASGPRGFRLPGSHAN
jgi:hypothetical protein